MNYVIIASACVCYGKEEKTTTTTRMVENKEEFTSKCCHVSPDGIEKINQLNLQFRIFSISSVALGEQFYTPSVFSVW